MCTAVTYQAKDFYFGRTLDYDFSYGEEVIFTPRNFPLSFRDQETMAHHHAILGMALVADQYPLYFDAVNEKGLAMAGLNFVGNAHYRENLPSKDNISHFEFIPWILSQCDSVNDAKRLLSRINLTNTPFSKQLTPAQLHWIIADREEAITVESVREGLRIYPNPVGVLTNNPPFDEQMFQLNNYMHLSPNEPENHFSHQLQLQTYSRGMGALGLPGDLSSQSRFVRAAFHKLNSQSGESEIDSVSQFFHILETVSQVRGSCHVGNGKYEITLYTSCCNADKGIYYYTTYENRQICAVKMDQEDLNGRKLKHFPLIRKEQIFQQGDH